MLFSIFYVPSHCEMVKPPFETLLKILDFLPVNIGKGPPKISPAFKVAPVSHIFTATLSVTVVASLRLEV